jgi:hypothetical protein
LEDYLSNFKLNLTTTPNLWIGGNLKPYVRSELEKKKISFFPSLVALDEFLSNF